MSLSDKSPEPLVTPCHSGPGVDQIFARIRHVMELAENPRHWSEANRTEPEAVYAWLRSVRFAAASRMDMLPGRDNARCTTRPVWLWMPLRPIHDRIQLSREGLVRYFPTAVSGNLAAAIPNMVARLAYLELLSKDVPNEGIDLVDKVWRALRWLPDLEIVHWSERPYTRYFRSLAFPYWTTIYAYEPGWRPDWCSACGFPLGEGIFWRVPGSDDQRLCPGCAQLHGAAVFKYCLVSGTQSIPQEMRPADWGWIPVSGPPRPDFWKQRSLAGGLCYWTVPEHEHGN